MKKLISKSIDKPKKEVFQIEKREDLPNDEKIIQIIRIFSGICAGVAIQPIPFADIFVLAPIQAYMGTRIAAIRGVPVSESGAKTVIKEILGVVGMGFFAQQIAIGAYKTVIPFLGALTTIPMVFGLTYAIGKVMDEYFKRKAQGENIDKETIKKIWRNEWKKRIKVKNRLRSPRFVMVSPPLRTPILTFLSIILSPLCKCELPQRKKRNA